MINEIIDHTLLKADSCKEDIERICLEAKEYKFKTVCVNPIWVSYASNLLKNTDIGVCTVIGFPLGASTTEVKKYEADNAVKNGADEIDMVINIGYLKSKDYKSVEEDIKAVVFAAKGRPVKVILETCLLNSEEIVKACELSKNAGASFVKTSTGFSIAGAKVEDVKLMREILGDSLGIKASGGIRDLKTAREMIKNGATRLGLSASVSIMKEYKNEF